MMWWCHWATKTGAADVKRGEGRNKDALDREDRFWEVKYSRGRLTWCRQCFQEPTQLCLGPVKMSFLKTRSESEEQGREEASMKSAPRKSVSAQRLGKMSVTGQKLEEGKEVSSGDNAARKRTRVVCVRVPDAEVYPPFQMKDGAVVHLHSPKAECSRCGDSC
jgi:hypothetical protein